MEPIFFIIIALIILFFTSKKLSKTTPKRKKIETKNSALQKELARGPSIQKVQQKMNTNFWYRAGKGPRFKNWDLSAGLIYFIDQSEPNVFNEASLIDTSLDIGRAHSSNTELSYWPQFKDMTPDNRATYLNWIQNGRTDQSIGIGYVFVHLYGLERRLLVERNRLENGEREAILEELLRLYHCYGSHRAFKGYLNNLVAADWLLDGSVGKAPATIDFSDKYVRIPFQAHLGKIVSEGKPISWQTAIQWMNQRQDYAFRTPARRCPEEFKRIFSIRYRQKFGDGLIVKPNKTNLDLEYHAGNPTLSSEVRLSFPGFCDPFELLNPLKQISTLAEQCTDEIEPYSRYIGKKGSHPKSIEALTLLPKEMMETAPETLNLKEALENYCASEFSLVKISDIFLLLGIDVGPSTSKVELTRLAESLDIFRFGLAPDVRFHLSKPESDGNIVIFKNKTPTTRVTTDRSFEVMATLVKLCSLVCKVDGEVHESEEFVLRNLIEGSSLGELEKISLRALSYWSVRNRISSSGLKSMLASLSESEKSLISNILIEVANADGKIERLEVKELEKIYELIGLGKDRVAQDLNLEKKPSIDSLIEIAKAEEGIVYAIPSPEELAINTQIEDPSNRTKVSRTEDSSVFKLDEERIAKTREKTKQAQMILAKVFAYTEEVEVVTERPAQTNAQSSHLEKLGDSYQKFLLELIQKEDWERASVKDLCKKNGLMLDGAVEAINEWSYQAINSPVIEDSDRILVDIELARELMNVE